MAFVSFVLAAAFVASAANPPEVGTQKLRGRQTIVHQAADLEKSLIEILSAIDAGEGDDYASRRLLFIETAMARTFQALPKNEYDRLSPRSVHYIVHHYFAEEHGWQIRGFEAHFSADMVLDKNVAVLEDHLPAALEGLLEARRSHRGLALGDCVAIAALLERLIAEQSVSLLESAYRWHNRSVAELLDKTGISNVLRSVVVLLRDPDVADIAVNDESLRFIFDGMEVEERVFQEDSLGNAHFELRHKSNPFTAAARQYSFQEASLVVHRLTHKFGKFSNAMCKNLKRELLNLSPYKAGLVPLSTFYASDAENNSFGFLFWESTSYLRSVGALEESEPKNPQVRIANYIQGPSNCVGRSAYHSVCCIDECKSIMSELEGAVRSPFAPPDRLAHLVREIAKATTDKRNVVTKALEAKLHAIASHHGGSVPLHGRLFAQWLHLALPNECMYPHLSADSNVSRQSLIDNDYRSNYRASQADIDHHVAKGREVQHLASAPETSAWTDDEVLPLLERAEPEVVPESADWLRTVMMLTLSLAMLRAAFSMRPRASSKTFTGWV